MNFAAFRVISSATALAVVFAGVSACRGRSQPVGTLQIEPKVVTLAYPLAVPLKFRWTPTRELGRSRGSPRVFVHLLDGGRRILRTFDHILPEPWTPDRAQSYEIDLYQSAIADRLPAGAYELTFGLYDSGRDRWPLSVDGEEVGRREYRLGTVTVPEPAGPAPSFGFKGGWLPVEPGGSRQVLARRCLKGEGSIAVVAPPSAGTVWVAASLRADGTPPGAGAYRVSASCSPQTTEISGIELQWIGFPVSPSTGDSDCEIRFTPIASSAQTSRPLCLEVLAWRPAGR
ncbi:MAG TPA: hypothetical protein VGK08_00200 [Thermoanaerobaculia bacterium]